MPCSAWAAQAQLQMMEPRPRWPLPSACCAFPASTASAAWADGGDQAGRTCAENDGVIGLGVGGLFCLGLGGEAEAGGAGSGGTEEGGLEKTAAAHIGMRHC